MEDRRGKNDKVSRGVWKIIEANTGKIRAVKAKERGGKRESRKKVRRKKEKEKAKERKNSRSEKDS